MRHDDLTQDAKTKFQDLGADAKQAAYSEAERHASQARDGMAERVENVANAAEAAGAEFNPDSLQSRAAQQVADQVEGLASRLRSADLQTVTRDVSSFARKNPALFIGGAALLGFAATRFLKARDPDRVDYTQSRGDPWGGDTPRPSTPRGYDVPS